MEAGGTQAPSASARRPGSRGGGIHIKGLDRDTEGPGLNCTCFYPGDTGHDVATVGMGIPERGRSWVCEWAHGW